LFGCRFGLLLFTRPALGFLGAGQSF